MRDIAFGPPLSVWPTKAKLLLSGSNAPKFAVALRPRAARHCAADWPVRFWKYLVGFALMSFQRGASATLSPSLSAAIWRNPTISKLAVLNVGSAPAGRHGT